MAFDSDFAFDSDNPFDPEPVFALRYQVDRYSIPGASIDDTLCVPSPLCDCYGEIVMNPPLEDCSVSFDASNGSGFPCLVTNFNRACVPIWFIRNAIDVYASGCPTIPDGTPFDDLCEYINGEVPDSPTAVATRSICCYRECWKVFVDRKSDETCLTIDDFNAGLGGLAPDQCRAAFVWILFKWARFGHSFQTYHCLGLPLPLLPGQVNLSNPNWQLGVNGPIVTRRVLRLPPGSYLVSSECVDMPLGEECGECPPLLS